MREYTVIYQGSVNTLIFYKNVIVHENETFEESLNIHGIDMCQLWMVFPGRHEAIMSDWTKL